MTRSGPGSFFTALPLACAALVLSAAVLLGGCVTEVRYAAPPPAYADAVVDEEMHAMEAPPPLPDYEQPPCPEEGYLWTPGYWAWAGGGYYWVPGTWVLPPRVGVLWTPGYWGFAGALYVFHAGYWGPHVGFYGGVNYGFGYGGIGFVGGRWSGNSFAYNRSVNNVNVTNIHNTYNETIVNNVTLTKVSYNGGAGGVAVVPTAQERAVAREPHVAATPLQRLHVQEAVRNPALAARANGGQPAIAATPKPAAFRAPGVVGSRGAPAPSFSASAAAAHAPAPLVRAPGPGVAGPGARASAGARANNSYSPAPGNARPTAPAARSVARPQAPGRPAAAKPQQAPKPQKNEKRAEGNR